MFEVSIVTSADPAIRLLCADSHELFKQPFAGYALLFFGAADEGVANWFARSLVSIDSLTGEDVACFIFAKKARVRASVTRYKTARPAGGARMDNAGAYELGSIQRSFSHRPLVDSATSLWRPSEEDIAVTTYEVDHIAGELGVTDRLPCMVFFDAVLSGSPGLNDVKSHRLAVLPIQDKPGAEVIRFLRRVLHRFRNSDDYVTYRSTLREFAEFERQAREYLWRYADPARREVSKTTENHLARLGRLDAFKSEIRRQIANGSLKGIRKALSKTPELPAQSIEAIESEIRAAKDELVGLNKTIGTLEYYSRFAGWPLSPSSRERLQSVGEGHVKPRLPDLELSRMVASPPGCEEAIDRLRAAQTGLVDAIAAKGPDIQAVVDGLCRDFNASIGPLQSTLRDREVELTKLCQSRERTRAYCASEEHPSLVSAAVAELASPAEANDKGHPSLTVFLMPNGVVGDTYIVGQAGAVGPAATAANTTLTSTGIPSTDDAPKIHR